MAYLIIRQKVCIAKKPSILDTSSVTEVIIHMIHTICYTPRCRALGCRGIARLPAEEAPWASVPTCAPKGARHRPATAVTHSTHRGCEHFLFSIF